ncbi:hypothetical protein [Pelagibacterium xiamenense]|uniref:hypothetical protein n=1 Tax=Pelagibacterium xiamenense TaxID=2901140 RepID=UPI001E2C8CE8|nr:hypothetical protein [Pelagibacterium xiamenense]MCD7061405.1 hypothetical protein [Pelagibacterium xiamenense]
MAQIDAEVQDWRDRMILRGSTATRLLNDLFRSLPRHGNGRKALVVLGRDKGGFNVYTYFAACLARHLGYDVTFLQCGGGTDVCGVRSNSDVWHPPAFCESCMAYRRSFDFEGFEVLQRNIDEVPVSYDAYSEEEISLDVDPFVQRVTFGRPPSFVDTRIRDMYRDAARRYYSTFSSVFREGDFDLCLIMNGLGFPEATLARVCEHQNTKTLYFDPGALRNTVFLSSQPTPHFRLDSLFSSYIETIEIDAAVERGREILLDRLSRQFSPEGKQKLLTIAGHAPPHRHAIMFLPLFHDLVSMGKGPINVFESVKEVAEIAEKRTFHLYLRSHPDEVLFPKSAFTADNLVDALGLESSPFLHVIPPQDRSNAYFLASRSELNIVYNGTLGIELAALGYPTMNIAKSHYTDKGFSSYPEAQESIEPILLQKWGVLPSEEEVCSALTYLHFYYDVANLKHDMFLSDLSTVYVRSRDAALEQISRISARAAHLLEGAT